MLLSSNLFLSFVKSFSYSNIIWKISCQPWTIFTNKVNFYVIKWIIPVTFAILIINLKTKNNVKNQKCFLNCRILIYLYWKQKELINASFMLMLLLVLISCFNSQKKMRFGGNWNSWEITPKYWIYFSLWISIQIATKQLRNWWLKSFWSHKDFVFCFTSTKITTKSVFPRFQDNKRPRKDNHPGVRLLFFFLMQRYLIKY